MNHKTDRIDKIKKSTSIPPISNKQHPLEVNDIKKSNKIRWGDINREYGYIYDEVGEYCGYTNSISVDWDILIKSLIDQIFTVLKKSNKSEGIENINSILDANKKAIIHILDSTNVSVNNVDKQEILCRIQSYIDNSI